QLSLTHVLPPPLTPTPFPYTTLFRSISPIPHSTDGRPPPLAGATSVGRAVGGRACEVVLTCPRMAGRPLPPRAGDGRGAGRFPSGTSRDLSRLGTLPWWTFTSTPSSRTALRRPPSCARRTPTAPVSPPPCAPPPRGAGGPPPTMPSARGAAGGGGVSPRGLVAIHRLWVRRHGGPSPAPPAAGPHFAGRRAARVGRRPRPYRRPPARRPRGGTADRRRACRARRGRAGRE